MASRVYRHFLSNTLTIHVTYLLTCINTFSSCDIARYLTASVSTACTTVRCHLPALWFYVIGLHYGLVSTALRFGVDCLHYGSVSSACTMVLSSACTTVWCRLHYGSVSTAALRFGVIFLHYGSVSTAQTMVQYQLPRLRLIVTGTVTHRHCHQHHHNCICSMPVTCFTLVQFTTNVK